jgi:hypothetical protein
MAGQRVRFPELNRLHAQDGGVLRGGAVRGLGWQVKRRVRGGPGCVIDGVDRTRYCAHNVLIGNRSLGLSLFCGRMEYSLHGFPDENISEVYGDDRHRSRRVGGAGTGARRGERQEGCELLLCERAAFGYSCGEGGNS